MSLSRLLCIWGFILVPVHASLACSASSATPPPNGTLSGVGGGPTAMAGACAPENVTEPCVCNTAPGRRTCAQGAWSACDCEPATVTAKSDGGTPSVGPLSFPGNARTDIHFMWQSTTPAPTDGTCPPGRYEGNIQGIYYSPLLIGAPLPIANLDLPGGPSGFYFDLEPALGGETLQRVHGQVHGQVDLAIPFVVDVEGALNCRSGVFTGKLLNGHYSVLIDMLLEQQFEGVAQAKYDKRTHTFINGAWDVHETTSNPPGKVAPMLPRDFNRDGFGGSGDFAAAFPTDPNDTTLKACPMNYACQAGPLGPNKMLCNSLLGVPACTTDADCAPQFPGDNVSCLKASLFSLCLRECKK